MKVKAALVTLAVSLSLFSVNSLSLDLKFHNDSNKIALPDMGDSSGTLITAQEEKEFGEYFFRSLHSQVTISQDPEIQQYIQSIGQKLVANSDMPSQAFHFFVVMENDINAFAGPGGYIGVNSGLILMSEVESELASVLAHEIAHVTQRHLYRAYEASSRLTIPIMAAALAAILLGTQNAAMGQAAIMAISAGAVQFQIDFTRENEAEADRVGMQTLAASASYDPRSMATFFERLQQATRYYGKNVPEFLRTHPVTTSRISDTRSRAENYPYKQYPDSLAYQLIKAKIRVLTTNNPNEAFNFFQNALGQGTAEQRTVARYGLGLSLLNLQKFKEAEGLFQALANEHPEQQHYLLALARTALEAKNFDLALARYSKLLEQFADNEAIKLEYIGALLKTDHAERAREKLAELSPASQTLPLYWEMLAQTYGQLKQPAESHRYLAEYYYATGQIRDAVLQIRLAQRAQRLNPQLAAILAERLTFFLTQEQAMSRSR